MRPSDNINELIKKLQLKASAELDKRVHDDISAALTKSEQTKPVQPEPNIWRTIMRSRIPKLAAAAVIIIAVLAGLPFFSGNGSGVVLADVLERIEQAKAFMYRMKLTMTGNMIPDMLSQQEVTATVSNEYGTKWEVDMSDPNTGKKMTQQVYVLPDQKMVITIMPETKQYMRMKLDDDWLVKMKRQNNDPREMIKQIMSCEYTELGRSIIDGIEVEGFRTTDPAFGEGITENVELTLWVDAQKWVPVRAEVDSKMNKQMSMHGVIYDYQWDISVEASQFQPVIPEDFTAFSLDGMKMPGMSEQAAIEGLRLFAEMSGQYPKKLNMIDFAQEISALKDNKYLTDELLRLKEQMSQTGQMTKEELRDALMKKSMDMMQPLQSPGYFHMMLVQDKKEPAYYGESVGTNDADAVLMRWKISDDEYRVIFGDLTIKNVPAEKLAELEKPLLEK